MLDDKLRVIKEEEDFRIKLGRKYVLAFSIINVVATLLSWLFTIYTWPLVIISLLLSIALYFFSITKFLWLVNSLYRAYFYLAVIFAMINQDFEFALFIIALFILIFDIYSSVKLLFSKSVEDYLYMRKTRK
jgi:hypothetical protein